MEKFVFKIFMNKEIIQKTIIFADTFNLKVDGWRPANTHEHPYRIVFYNDKMIVGYIDAETNYIGQVKVDMSFVLFTPVGSVIGNISTDTGRFKYSIENRKDSFESIEGVFMINKYDEKRERYHISSIVILNDLDTNLIRVIFDNSTNNYDIFISKQTAENYEVVKVNSFDSQMSLEHFDYPVTGRRYFAKINLDVEGSNDFVPVNFEFLDKGAYRKDIDFLCDASRYLSYRKKFGLINYDAFAREISENDLRMFSLIDEVKEDLTFLANGITPVSIYDRMAQLCFYDKIDKFKLDFTRSQNVEIALKHSLVLKK